MRNKQKHIPASHQNQYLSFSHHCSAHQFIFHLDFNDCHSVSIYSFPHLTYPINMWGCGSYHIRWGYGITKKHTLSWMQDKWRHLCILTTFPSILISTVFHLSHNLCIFSSASISSLKVSINIYPRWSTPLWKKVEISPNCLGFDLFLFLYLLKYMIAHAI